MKKWISMAVCLALIFALTACGSKPSGESKDAAEGEAKAWTREGYFQDDSENFLSITWMEVDEEEGWYVGCMLGEDSYGGYLPQEGNNLAGKLPDSMGEGGEITVTIAEEGEDGLTMTVEGGETYHFTVWDVPEASIFISINTEGMGNIAYAEGEADPEVDEDYPYQSTQLNLEKPAVYTLLAYPETGWKFVKWTKNGEDFSTEAQFTTELAETADYVAVFEQDADWENPLDPVAGEYNCDRAHAVVEVVDQCVFVNIDWGGSAWETAHWLVSGYPDLETLEMKYEGCPKSIITYDDNGEVKNEETEYEDGTGTVVFSADGSSFTWHDDKLDQGDMVFTRTE